MADVGGIVGATLGQVETDGVVQGWRGPVRVFSSTRRSARAHQPWATVHARSRPGFSLQPDQHRRPTERAPTSKATQLVALRPLPTQATALSQPPNGLSAGLPTVLQCRQAHDNHLILFRTSECARELGCIRYRPRQGSSLGKHAGNNP